MEKIIELLYRILFEKENRPLLIKEFQDIVWNLDANSKSSDVLKDLAYDLDYYEPDSRIRYEEKTYYGDERLEKEVEEALAKLKKPTT